MQPFESPRDLWSYFMQPGAKIHNPYENVTLRLKPDGFPERLSRIKEDTWVPHQIPLHYKCWERG